MAYGPKKPMPKPMLKPMKGAVPQHKQMAAGKKPMQAMPKPPKKPRKSGY